MGCGDWYYSRQSSYASVVGAVCCLLSRWAAHHLRILRPHHSNLGCGEWYCSRKSSQGPCGHGVVRCLLSRWVPHDCRQGLHSPAVLTIPLTSRIRSVSLDFDDFAFGTSWTQIFNSASS